VRRDDRRDALSVTAASFFDELSEADLKPASEAKSVMSPIFRPRGSVCRDLSIAYYQRSMFNLAKNTCRVATLLLCFTGAAADGPTAVPALTPCDKDPAGAFEPSPPANRWDIVLLTEADIPTALAAMTLEEKLGQLVQTDIAAATPQDVREHHIGSIISTVPTGDLGTARAWRELFDEYQRQALITRTGIPVVFGIDAVHGHSYFDGNSVILPHNIGLGATRNPELAKRLAEITARELSATGIRWTFSPSLAVARNIRWGRTFESLSEDIVLPTMFAKPLIEGYQGDDLTANDTVAATAKHFIADGATEEGIDRGDATITDAEIRAMHLPAFMEAIDAGVLSVMASFSSINGEKLHGSRKFLTDMLKDELRFDGVVVSDWEGVTLSGLTLAEGLNAGIDMFMFAESWKTSLPALIRSAKNGDVPIARIDDAVTRVLRMKLRLGLFDAPFSSAACSATVGSHEHREVARQAVRESLVLLKNDGVLPLSKHSKIVVVGSHADNVAYQSGGWTKKWQGAHLDLYGHAERDVAGATSILDGVRSVFGDENVIDGGLAGLHEDADVAIIVVGETPYAEGIGDRAATELVLSKEQRKLIRSYSDAGVDVVTVLISGRPLLVTEQIQQSGAFVAAWLPGSEGQGIAEVLSGEFNFSGKLSFSWPRDASQIPVNTGDTEYDPLYDYGYGLTY
jgi:beta-glucosidase